MRAASIIGLIIAAGLLGFGFYTGTWFQVAMGAAGLVVHGVVLRSELRSRRPAPTPAPPAKTAAVGGQRYRESEDRDV
ncbi:hypothetical protein AB0J63_26795 [Streptosporangium canum]|uniref:hypothetical protein n=1 Tax=Streptosporangium canum TaxID=324952 RepID=UPI00343250B1